MSACQTPGATPTPANGAAAYPNEGTAPAVCPTPAPAQLALFSPRSVTAEDSGKTLVIRVTDRFSVFLDDGTYPLNELQANPTGILGVVSNGSVRGPNCYPIMFEAITDGKGTLSDRGFVLNVVVDDNATRSPFPLH